MATSLTQTGITFPDGSSQTSTVFSGLIAMWSGSIGSIPAGWKICDGTNGTPDLRDRFILGVSNQSSVCSVGGFANVDLVIHTHATDSVTSTSGAHAHDTCHCHTASTGPNDNSMYGPNLHPGASDGSPTCLTTQWVGVPYFHNHYIEYCILEDGLHEHGLSGCYLPGYSTSYECWYWNPSLSPNPTCGIHLSTAANHDHNMCLAPAGIHFHSPGIATTFPYSNHCHTANLKVTSATTSSGSTDFPGSRRMLLTPSFSPSVLPHEAMTELNCMWVHGHTGCTTLYGGHRHCQTDYFVACQYKVPSHTHNLISASFLSNGCHTHELNFSLYFGDYNPATNYDGSGHTHCIGSPSSLNFACYPLSISSNGSHAHAVTVSPAPSPSTGVNANLPPYYALFFIMKI